MLFNSPAFIFLFLPVAVAVYYLLRGSGRDVLARGWLVLASLFFYAFWNPIYLPLLIASVLVNFFIGKRLGARPGHSRAFLVAGIVFNLGLLGWFKYADFFISNINYFGGHLQSLSLVLPLAISFFTFQQIAYLVDSYQGKTREYDFLNYSLFVTFFPQLIAGPIVHHKEMMPQFESAHRSIDWNRIACGLFIFSLGLFKKTVIADSFAIWANAGYANPEALTFLSAWGTSFSYTFQLYYDFSAYTDMAIGAALLFNIRLPINFNSPYKALNIQDFWRRWHITLSRWLRDYLYIPLGGNRRSAPRAWSNIFITFLLGGLWHGAGWTFVIWGALHGMAMVLHRFWTTLGLRLPKFLGWLTTFLFVNITWVYFRAESITDAHQVLSKMGQPKTSELRDFLTDNIQSSTHFTLEKVLDSGGIFVVPVFIFSFGLIFSLLAFLAPNTVQMIKLVPYRGRYQFRPGILTGIITAVIFFLAALTFAGAYSPGEFIYFNF